MECEGCGRETGLEPDGERPEGAVWLCLGCAMANELGKMADEGDVGAQSLLADPAGVCRWCGATGYGDECPPCEVQHEGEVLHGG